MGISELFQKKRKRLSDLKERRAMIREELLTCPKCGHSSSYGQLMRGYGICPACGYYYPLTPKERIRLIADDNEIRIQSRHLRSSDPLAFPGYTEKLDQLRAATGEEDAVVTGLIKIDGMETAIGILDTKFLMGSMGTVVGERITRITEYAARHKLPLIIFCASGGARMQEGLYSLMQMAKTAAAIEHFKKMGGLYVSVLCNPTTGGVSASFAFLGDLILAEPGALIGFAGPRVIKQTIREELPEGFQSAESQVENGMIDRIVTRNEQRELFARILRLHRRA